MSSVQPEGNSNSAPVYIRPDAHLQELQDALQRLYNVDPATHSLSLGGILLRPDISLERQGVRNRTVIALHRLHQRGLHPPTSSRATIAQWVAAELVIARRTLRDALQLMRSERQARWSPGAEIVAKPSIAALTFQRANGRPGTKWGDYINFGCRDNNWCSHFWALLFSLLGIVLNVSYTKPEKTYTGLGDSGLLLANTTCAGVSPMTEERGSDDMHHVPTHTHKQTHNERLQ